MVIYTHTSKRDNKISLTFPNCDFRSPCLCTAIEPSCDRRVSIQSRRENRKHLEQTPSIIDVD
jgi:hypothetical protein